MAQRTLELTLLSAKDLKEVNVLSRMNVYAVAALAGDGRSQQRTPVDRNGGRNPSWNASFRFQVPADPAHLDLSIVLRAERTFGDRDVGEVRIPVKDLLAGFTDGSKFVSYQVRSPHSNKAKGILNLSYKFVDLPAAASPLPPVLDAKPAGSTSTYPPTPSGKPPKESEPVMAYPAAGASLSGYPPSYPPTGGYQPYPPQGAYPPSYPPQQAGYGYGTPPPAGYGYGAPQGGGYGYGAVPPRKQKNKLGMGLGAGLLGGALGGLFLGDMVSDAAYDSGYDNGLDDGFGDGFGDGF